MKKKLLFELFFVVILGQSLAQIDTSYNVQKGLDFAKQEKFKEAFSIFSNAAKKGNAYAQCLVGYLYDVGDGVEQNYKTAVDWYRKSADNGNSY